MEIFAGLKVWEREERLTRRRRESDRLSSLLIVQEDLPEESKIDWHRHETASDEQRKARCLSFAFII